MERELFHGDKPVTPGAANVRGIGGASPAPALGAALLLLLGACAASAPPPPAPPPSSSWSVQTLTWQRIAGDCDGPAGCLSVHLEYPRLLAAPGGPSAAEAIDRFVRVDLLAAAFGGGGASPEELTRDLAAEQREILAENPDVPHAWTIRQKIDVLLQEPERISLRAWSETYLGGERQLEWISLASFDARTGARLRLEDLVDLEGEGRARFLQAVEARLRADRQIPADQSLEDAGFATEDGYLPLPEEFALAPEGLVLHWGLFVLGSEELGMVTVVVPREVLRI